MDWGFSWYKINYMFSSLSDRQIALAIKLTVALIIVVLIWVGASFLYGKYLKKDKLDFAIEKAIKEANASPNDIRKRTALADLLLGKGRVSEAIIQYKQALKINSKYEPALLGIGMAYFKNGDKNMALASFKKEIEVGEAGSSSSIDKYLEQAYFYQGKILLSRKSYSKAADSFKKALKIAPLMSDTHFLLGRSEAAIGNKNEAKAHFKEALKLNPQLTQAKEALSNLGN